MAQELLAVPEVLEAPVQDTERVPAQALAPDQARDPGLDQDRAQDRDPGQGLDRDLDRGLDQGTDPSWADTAVSSEDKDPSDMGP